MIDIAFAVFALFLGALTDDHAPPLQTDDNAQEAYADSLRY